MNIAQPRTGLLLAASVPILAACVGSDRIAFATVDNM